MTILTHRVAWKRGPTPRKVAKADLTAMEQAQVLRALTTMKIRLGGSWVRVAKTLQIQPHTFDRVRLAPTLSAAFRVARWAAVPLEDVLAGRWPVPGSCPMCGQRTPAMLPAPKG
jgi:hypothetical protein